MVREALEYIRRNYLNETVIKLADRGGDEGLELPVRSRRGGSVSHQPHQGALDPAIRRVREGLFSD